MNHLTGLALVCNALVCGGSIAFGIGYLARSRIMPYHETAAGASWDALDPRLQILLLSLMRVAGGGLLGAGLAEAIFLAIPLRAEENWTPFAFLVVSLASLVPTCYATIAIRLGTGARTPIAVSAAGVILSVLGFILSRA